ncbi:MAG: L-serine ammonia-lyase, iron-sulfur-dependent, subunit alpha [Mogibacterium sp.]|nr:L-serine ammonia-lyase, iron-sulfur-dependent, subunit alpha [Mogibacterium sp.]
MADYDFRNAAEMLSLCDKYSMSISEIMLQREMELGNVSWQLVMETVDECLRVMDGATKRAGEDPVPSMGGLIGGEARKLRSLPADKCVLGRSLHKAVIYALAVAETNASMGVIVAAPTAGAAGILPAALLALFDDKDISMDALRMALINASAIGYIITRNGSVSGAEAGCQAEVGSASAMAASAVTELLGGTPEQCCHAASIALSNLLGLVCDPVRGLVEVPCQTRNTAGVACAYTAAEIALADIPFAVPLDEMIAIVYDVGRKMPESLRETGLGGCAAAPSVCANCGK